MRRLAAVLALGLALALVAALAGWSASSSARPSLRLAATQPLTLKGVRFKRAERVRLAVRLGGDVLVRRIPASAAGSFVAAFDQAEFDPCNGGLVATAVGSAGSKAGLKVPQRECPPRL